MLQYQPSAPISVVIPSYMPGDYIFECLESLVFQTIKIEIVLVLNGPKEPYYSKILPFLSNNFETFQLIQTPTASVSHARNLGMKSASGKYLFFIDDDDLVSHEALTNMYSRASTQRIVMANSWSFDEGGQLFTNYINQEFKNSKKSLIQNRSCYSNVVGKLIPQTIAKDFLFDEDLFWGEDSLFMAELSCQPFTLIKDQNSFYLNRLRKDSASRSQPPRWKTLKNGMRLLHKYFNLIYNPNYHSFFIFTRIAATIRNMTTGIYEPLKKMTVQE